MALRQYQLMQEEQQRQARLKQVIGQLSSIKLQLHQLMLPKSDERTSDTNFKAFNIKLKQQQPIPITPLYPEHFRRNQIKQSPTNSSPDKKFPDQPTSILSKAKEHRQKCDQSKKIPCNIFQKQSPSRQKLSIGLNVTESQLSRNQRLSFQRKRKQQTENKSKLAEIISQKGHNDLSTRRQNQFAHIRHNSLQELQLPYSLKSQQLQKSSTHKKFIDLAKIQEKQFFLLRKNVELKPSIMPKTLTRVKSDLIDFSSAITKDTLQEHDFIKRIQQLESENISKERAIKMLQKQLRSIEISFNDMKYSIVDLLQKGLSFRKNMQPINFNQAFAQIIKDFNLQKEEIKRLKIEGEGCRKQIYQQSLKIRLYEEEIKQYTVNGDAVAFFRGEENKFKDRIANICSKLQMATNQNHIKDQFIIKYIMGKAVGSKDEELISSLLENYLKMCEYPKNRLMDKLNQQQLQIKRLKSQFEKKRKNSL